MERSGERMSVEAEGEAVARRTERCEHCEKCCYATKGEICLDVKSQQIFCGHTKICMSARHTLQGYWELEFQTAPVKRLDTPSHLMVFLKFFMTIYIINAMNEHIWN